MKMKWYVLPIFIILILFFFSCSAEKAIEEVIQDFEDAANNNDLDAMEATLSPQSQWDITQLQTQVLGYLNPTYTPLEFTDLSIDVDKPDAEVTATHLYKNSAPDTAYFIMREEEKFFSFLFPDWRIKEFYDFNDLGNPVWKKLKK